MNKVKTETVELKVVLILEKQFSRNSYATSHILFLCNKILSDSTVKLDQIIRNNLIQGTLEL